MLRIRDTAAAEDIVQATLLAALQAQTEFRGDSSARTWLIGILKNKIIDHFRARSRDAVSIGNAAASAGYDSEEDFMDSVFGEGGAWMSRPGSWDGPDRALEQDGFWSVLESCIQAVPGVAGRAFVLRELVGLETEEICKELNISRTNYWVLMHRARLRLRDCLEKHWFMVTRK